MAGQKQRNVRTQLQIRLALMCSGEDERKHDRNATSAPQLPGQLVLLSKMSDTAAAHSALL